MASRNRRYDIVSEKDMKLAASRMDEFFEAQRKDQKEKDMEAKRGKSGTNWAQLDGVTPSVETNGCWHTCRSLIFPSQTISFPPESSSAGEAEAGSGGDQPAEE
jgi:hypothetical protein